MKRANINTLAERFCNYMISQTMNGNYKSGSEWAKELGCVYPNLPLKEKRRVANKILRFIKAAGNPNDASM